MTDAFATPNRLVHEASPYLQQHAHNPVDWYPWGDEALARARSEDKPIFLSIGYSACHWCHVMEHESFADPEIAALMNAHFINVKVDREERPDVDQVYMTVCQLVTRQGGWPLSVWLTPDQRPFYVGTYYPPTSLYGRPGFRELLQGIHQAWTERRDEVLQVAQQWTEALQQMEQAPQRLATPADTAPDAAALLDQAAAQLEELFDHKHGGFGHAPKFPSPDAHELLLLCLRRTGKPKYLQMAQQSGSAMAMGGIYDHLGGGFHRYSVDARWAVPHFEKMLYDNALLAMFYLNLYRVTDNHEWARVVRETLSYVEREMTDPAGGFYSTQDADSEGEEGKFFVWTPEQVKAVLGEADGDLACRRWGITQAGNFEEGTTVLHIARTAGELAEDEGTDEQNMTQRLEDLRRRLWAARERRVHPGRDDKILTGWNGLMISAFARAGRTLHEPQYIETARRAADFIIGHLGEGDDRLLRRYKDGQTGIPGYLEDYAYFTAALIDLYEATFAESYLLRAAGYARAMLDRFADPGGAGFYLTPDDGEPLILRPRDVHDSAMPAAQSVALQCLLRLYPFTGEERFVRFVDSTLKAFATEMERSPLGTTSLLATYDLNHHGTREVTIVASPDDAEAAGWLRTLHKRYLPDLVLTRVQPGRQPDTVTASLTGGDGLPPIWAGKTDTAADGQATAYVCRQFTCSPPARSWAELERHLA